MRSVSYEVFGLENEQGEIQFAALKGDRDLSNMPFRSIKLVILKVKSGMLVTYQSIHTVIDPQRKAEAQLYTGELCLHCLYQYGKYCSPSS